jgi:integrase
MHTFQRATLNQESLVFNYLPAILKKNKSGWLIEYYCENPIDNVLYRKKIRVDNIRKRYKKQSDSIIHIYKIITEINNKLAHGWNPFITLENSRLYYSFKEVSAKFIEEKEKELRPDSIRCYKSFINTFNKYLETNGIAGKYTSQFNKLQANQYLDYLYNVKSIKARSYNNYLKFMRCFFEWMKEKGYVNFNFFTLLKTKKKEKKKRCLIDAQTRQKITDYLKVNNPQYLIVCKLVYYSLIRPKEIINLRISDIDLENKVIKISSENAKNHHQRFSAMTPDLIQELQYIKNYDPDLYFISQTMFPGPIKAHRSKFTKIWIKLRNELKIPLEMQLYSFRDTGISEMIKSGIDPLTVKQHADHYSLDMTSIYADHHDPDLSKKIYEFAPIF